MVCEKCGTEVSKKDKFCPKCGVELVKGRKKKNNPEVEEYQLKEKEIEKLSQSFASRDEKYIASLGNGYIVNYLTNNSMKKGFAFITDKRVYFKGSCLSGKGKAFVKTDEERTVDVKNITGSGFLYRRYWGILIALFISILVSLAGTIIGIWFSHDYEFVESTREPDSYDTVIESDDEKVWWEEILSKLDELKWEEIDTGEWKAFYAGECICEISAIHNKIRSDDYYLIYDNSEEISVNDSLTEIVEKTEKLLASKIEHWQALKMKEDRRAFTQTIITLLFDMLSIAIGLPLVIVFCIGFKNYLLKRKTLFRIEYAGGCIAFDVSFYAKAEIDDFQKQLRRVKDLAEETAVRTVSVDAPVQAPTQNSVPDDLRKYADLLKEGLISQEEYDAMKKKILGL